MAIEQGLAPHFDACNACNIKMLRDPPHGADQREPPRNALELLDAPNDEATAMDEGAGWITTDIDWSWWFGVAPNDPKHAHDFKSLRMKVRLWILSCAWSDLLHLFLSSAWFHGFEMIRMYVGQSIVALVQVLLALAAGCYDLWYWRLITLCSP